MPRVDCSKATIPRLPGVPFPGAHPCRLGSRFQLREPCIPDSAKPASSFDGHKQDSGGRIAPALLRSSAEDTSSRNRGKRCDRSQHPGGDCMVRRRCRQQQRLCLGIVGLVEHGERLRATRRLHLICCIENSQHRCSPLFWYGGGHANRNRAGNRFRRRGGSRQEWRRRWRGGLDGDWRKCQRIKSGKLRRRAEGPAGSRRLPPDAALASAKAQNPAG